ncbi:MAG: ribose 1,5-bisphosphate isomerase [Candidatus Diapherotrites archaeon]|nr:ribose 1,5-bisphosphate isomerase [Candidatus Diapherotrites archaeon]
MKSKTTAQRIKRLEIQGARNIARKGLEALAFDARRSKAKTLAAFGKEVEKNSALLAGARPTEPALRNGLALVQSALAIESSLPGAKEAVAEATTQYAKQMEEAKKKIVQVGVKRIRSGMTVFTHCHSSTVTAILVAAWKKGKRFDVINTETRPRFQGRITARELVGAGIPVTHIVDSAARRVMNEADLVLVGADAVTAEGSLVNKIGTSMIALAAHEARTEFASACETFKFDPLTLGGEDEPIEYRSPKEVWARPPRGLSIRNPAFDVTPPEYIDYIITEEGIIPPSEVAHILRERARW